jgi:plastocyanin
MRTAHTTRRTLIALAVGVVLVGGAVWFVQRADTPTAALDTEDVAGTDRSDHHYTIPAGTGDRIDAGERVALLPQELTVRVGEVLSIVNEDDRGHAIGPFYVGPGQTLRQRFTAPGEFEGDCTVHPDGTLRLLVID